MKMMIATLWCSALILVAGCARGAATFPDLKSVIFRVTAESDGTPLVNREMQVFDGRYEDVVFEFVKTKASEQKHYLATVVTDTNGCFTLNLSDPKIPEEIIIQPGPPYDVMRIQRATFERRSPLHIRIVRFVKGASRVERNDIYDLRRKTVRQIPLKGKEVEIPFQAVLLVAQEIRKPAQQQGGGYSPPAARAAQPTP
jgi:hypothetical protein